MDATGGATANLVICTFFTACEASMAAAAMHAAAPLLLMCMAARFSKPYDSKTSGSGVDGASSSILCVQVLLALCVLLDGIAAALPLMSHVVPGMITLTGQVAAVSGGAAWSSACALMVLTFTTDYALDCTIAVVVWAVVDIFGGALSIADAACGGIGSTGVLWRSASAVLVVCTVTLRLLLLLLLLFPRFGYGGIHAPEDDPNLPDDFDDLSPSSNEDSCGKRGGTVVWGLSGPEPVLGNALENSSWLAHVFITWPDRMLSAARVRPLFHGDVSAAPAETHPAVALDTFLLLWARRVRDRTSTPQVDAPLYLCSHPLYVCPHPDAPCFPLYVSLILLYMCPPR